MRNDYNSFKEKVNTNAKRNNYIVLVDSLPASTLSYFKKRLREDLSATVFSDLIFTTSKKALKLQMDRDGSLKKENEKFTLKEVKEKKKEESLPSEESGNEKLIRNNKLLKEEVIETRRLVDKLEKEKLRILQRLDDAVELGLKLKCERDVLQKSYTKINEEITSLKSQIENSDAKMLILSGIMGKCQSCGLESSGELIKDIIVFKCRCGRKEYKNIIDSVLKLTF